MKQMEKRLRSLEQRRPVLSPGAKRWLGHPLTEKEEMELASAPETDEPNFSSISVEAREWLGMPAVDGKQPDTTEIT